MGCAGTGTGEGGVRSKESGLRIEGYRVRSEGEGVAATFGQEPSFFNLQIQFRTLNSYFYNDKLQNISMSVIIV